MVQKPNHMMTFKVGIALIGFGLFIFFHFGLPPLLQINQSIQNPRCDYELDCLSSNGGHLSIFTQKNESGPLVEYDATSYYDLSSNETFSVGNPIDITANLITDNPNIWYKAYAMITYKEENYTVGSYFNSVALENYRNLGLTIDLNAISQMPDGTYSITNGTGEYLHGDKVWTPSSEGTYVLVTVIESKDGSFHLFPQTDMPIPVQPSSVKKQIDYDADSRNISVTVLALTWITVAIAPMILGGDFMVRAYLE